MKKTWEVFFGSFSTFILAKDEIEASKIFLKRFNTPLTKNVIKSIKQIDLNKEMERLTHLCKMGEFEANKAGGVCRKI